MARSVENIRTKVNDLLHALNDCPFVGFEDRTNLVLLLIDLKSACLFQTSRRRGETLVSKMQFELNLKSFTDLCSRFGLSYEIRRRESNTSSEIAYVFVSKTYTTAFQGAWIFEEVAGHAERARAFGVFFEIPPTAVDVFASNQNRVIRKKELPEVIQADPTLCFLWFMLSRDHWIDELKSVRFRAQVIRRLAPDLYQQTITRFTT